MKFNITDIKSIIRAQENDTLTIFVGAGFSKFAETETIKFPNWDELMDSFIKDLNVDENDADRHNHLKLAQLYFLEFGEYRLYERLKEVISLHATPRELHKALLDLKPKYLLTTNWDNLLEKTITEQGLLYDVIKSDADFVKSTLPKKLIKIHGDLDSHNIVFKEDDYLNYSLNMPLIDNFLRHVLSSTTVLFLGYSYSDTDLKQIVKWIEKNSPVSPPRFLLNFKSRMGRTKYYENHSIRIISPDEDTGNFKQLYTDFFEHINNSEKILTMNLQNEVDIVDYFFSKLQDLAELNALLPEQITELFSNCTIEYHNNCFGLWFHKPKGVLTLDYDEGVRELYSKFFEVLQNVLAKPKHPLKTKMDFIISCFALANIRFLKYERHINIFTDYFDEKNHLPEKLKSQDKAYWSFITFSEQMAKNLFKPMTFSARSEVKLGFDNEKFIFLENLNALISENKREKMYFKALINQFNYRFVATSIILDYKIKKNQKEEVRQILNNLDKKFSISDYPKKYEKSLKVLLDFLEFKFVYNLYYKSQIDNMKVIQNAEIIKNGGFGSYDKDRRSEDNCIQALRFISANEINMDFYTEFKDLMQAYVNSKLALQFIQEKFSLAEHDLFILIKYFKFDDLLFVIYKKILPLSKKVDLEISLATFSEQNSDYLKETLDNLLKLFVEYSHSFYTNIISNAFVNLLTILSLVKWKESDLEQIINKILQAFNINNYPYNLIKAIDKFVLINHSLHNTKTNLYIKFIDSMFIKFIQGELNRVVHDKINNEFRHIYQVSQLASVKYENLDLVGKVIDYIGYLGKNNTETKRYLFRLFLLQVMSISNEQTKQAINNFLNDLRIKEWSIKLNNNYREIFSELDFLQYGANLSEDFTSFLESWIENYLNIETISDLELLKQGGIELMAEYFEYLHSQQNISAFAQLKNKLDDKIREILSNSDDA